MAADDSTAVDLDPDEVALIVREEDGSLTARVVAGPDVPTDGSDLPAAPEFVVALAKRLRRDPDFVDEVLDWFYEHQDDAPTADDDEEES